VTISLEICVDDLRGLQIANDADVDRIELCSALDQGGLTPTPELISQARQADVPIYAMIRPRGVISSMTYLKSMPWWPQFKP